MVAHKAELKSPTLLIMPFTDIEEEREWDRIARRINERNARRDNNAN